MIGKILKRGLLAIAPLAISLVLIVWLFTYLETLFQPIVLKIFGFSFPGFGIIIAVIVLFVIGILINTYLAKKFMEYLEITIEKIPLLKTLYFAIRDIAHYIQKSAEDDANKVVKAQTPLGDLLGFITRDSFEDLDFLEAKDQVLVFFPMSYQIGGYSLFIKKENIKVLNINVKEAMEFILVAGAKEDHKRKKTDAKPKKESDDLDASK